MRFITPGITLLLILVLAGAPYGKTSAPCHETGHGLYVAPDRHCTPGAFIDDSPSRARVCRRDYNPRPPLATSEALKRQAMTRYGIPRSEAGRYEADHRVPVWLGGASIIDNIWPEPNYAQPAGYDLNPKDKLEFAIYKLVCRAESMTVDRARRLFEGDWRRAYDRYVGARTTAP